jgi:hypothetical protein
MGHFNRPVPSPRPSSATAAGSTNVDGSIIPSASHTNGAVTSDEMYNASARGVRLYITISAVGVGDVTTKIQTKDPVTDTFVDLGTTAAQNSNGTLTLTVYPGITAAAGTASTSTTVNGVLGTTWRVVSTVANATGSTDTTVTFAVSGEYLY